MHKPIKFSSHTAVKIELDNKDIYKYPTPTDKYDIARMVVKGRFPKNGSFTKNKVCDFFIYVLKGNGIIYAGDEKYEVHPSDVVFVPAKNKYAVEGKFEYITVDVPAYKESQNEEVKS